MKTIIENTFKVTAFIPANGMNTQHRKEKNFYQQYSIVSYEDNVFSEPVTVRFYKTPATTYVCVWCSSKMFDNVWHPINGSGVSSSLSGQESIAFESALESMGVTISKEIAGEKDIKDSIKALAQFLKIKNFTLINANG